MKSSRPFEWHTLISWFAIACFVFVVISYREKFTSRYNHETLGKIYSESQYVKGPAATTSIGDDGLFAVAGYYLFFQGGDPSQIHFEGPPLGEYLIGLSIKLFGNERVINIFYGIIFFILTYKIGVILFKDKLVSSLAILLIVFDPLFHEHIISSLLDLPLAMFTLAGLYFFIKGLWASPAHFFLSTFFWGAAAATKFFPGIIIFLIIMLWWCKTAAPQNLGWLFVSLLIIPVVFVSSYTAFFIHHPTVIEFLKFQWWVIDWRLGNPRVIGNIFTTFLIGRYRSWWPPYAWVIYREWTILSPLVTIFGLGSIVWVRKQTGQYLFLYLMMLIFFIYIGVATTGVAKYVYPVYPLLTLFAAKSLLRIGRSLVSRKS